MVEFCTGREHNLGLACSNGHDPCDRLQKYADQLYTATIHPLLPCNQCIIKPMREYKPLCEEFRVYCNIVRAAQCELTGDVIVFGENPAILYIGPVNGSTMERFQEVETACGIRIDFDFSERYIRQLRNDRLYRDILEMERQRLRTCG